MRTEWMWGCCLSLALFHAVGGAAESPGAEDVQALMRRIEEQGPQIQALTARIKVLETRSSRSAEPAVPPAPIASGSREAVKISGDMRYRHELVHEEERASRTRHRIRARVGVSADVRHDLAVVFRVASGSSDPVSANQTLDGGASSKDVWIDLACFDWRPALVPGLSLSGGKVENPFRRVGGTGLLWDGDLNPEGLALTHSASFGALGAFLNLGGFWVEERSEGADSGLFGLQAGLRFDVPGGDVHLLGGLGYFDYGNAKGHPTFYDPDDSFGNSTDASGNYAADFDELEAFAEIGFALGWVPTAVFGDFVTNTAAGDDEEGWLIGLALGRCEEPGSWELRYNYRRVEADAVVGAFTDSDFAGGGTDVEGHEFGLEYQMARRVKTGVTYFLSKKDLDEGIDYERFQLDIGFKF